MTKGLLAGQTALITGAGRGIGRGLALGLAAESAKVVCAARTAAQIDETAQAIRQAGGEAIAAQCDVTSPSDVQALYAATRAAYGRLDIVIANAGANSAPSPLEESDIEGWARTIEVNLLGVYYTAKFAIPDLKVRGGHIIVIGSGLGHRVGDSANSAYSVSKAGAWMLVRTLAKELSRYAICVNELIPGLVRTDMTADTARPADSPLRAEWFKGPADVVPLALFMAAQPLTGPTGQSFSLMRRDSQ